MQTEQSLVLTLMKIHHNQEIIKNYNSQITAPGPTQPEQAPKKVWPWPIIEMPGGTASSARGSNLASVFWLTLRYLDTST